MQSNSFPYIFWAFFCILTGFLLFFGDELGGFTGMTGKGSITNETPGCLIRLFGYGVLIVQLYIVWGLFRESVTSGLIHLAVLGIILLLFYVIAQRLD